MKIVQRSLASIKPYPGNPRKNDAAVDAVARSIQEFGFRQPIVVDAKGVIIAGHTRYKAARKLGLKKVPVHVAADLTSDQARALRLVDNKTHELSEWDLEALNKEVATLDLDLSIFGFTDDDFQAGAEDLSGLIREIKIERPIERVWVLAGIPADAYMKHAEALDLLAQEKDVIYEATIR